MPLVAGVDSSTQSVKVLICDAETGEVVREGRGDHPDGTSVDPQAWEDALTGAIAQAGGLDDVAAVSVGGQQHGMVALDADGQVVRDALLWNDTRSAAAAAALTAELGAEAWATRTGSVPVASYTVTKLRWLADNEPDNAERVAAVALPHDWLSWKLGGSGDLGELATDRSDASGTGYFDPSGDYDIDLLVRALGHEAILPRVAGPAEAIGRVGGSGALIGPGAGDNAGAALGLGLRAGEASVSLGTSGVVAAVSDVATHDASGLVSGFADATGRFLPLACTLNAARVLDAFRTLLGVDHARFDELALSTPSFEGLVLVPYLEGERTPNLPDATGSLLGLRLGTVTPGHLARAAVEGMLCGIADGLDAMRDAGVRFDQVALVGGAAKSAAVRALAPAVLGVDVVVPAAGEYVARGAARQAAWVLAGGDEPPAWPLELEGEPLPTADDGGVRERYAAARAHWLPAT